MRSVTKWASGLLGLAFVTDMASTLWALSQVQNVVLFESNPLMWLTDSIWVLFGVGLVELVFSLWLLERYYKEGWVSVMYLMIIVTLALTKLMASANNIYIGLNPPTQEQIDVMLASDPAEVKVKNTMFYVSTVMVQMVWPYLIGLITFLIGSREWKVTPK